MESRPRGLHCDRSNLGRSQLPCLAKRFLSRQGALRGAAFYVANPYAFLNIYMRSALAELLACAVIPAAVLSSLELSGLSGSSERFLPRATACCAVRFVVVWLSNVLAFIWIRYC